MKYRVTKKQNNSDMCFVCGLNNQAGLHTKFYELEHQIILGVFHGENIHQSYPTRMHGGIITALLDETIGRAIQIIEPNSFGVTYDLNIRFQKPVPLHQILYAVGKITEDRKRLFLGEGYLCTSDGQILATCNAKYFKQDIKDIVSKDNYFLEEQWIYVDDEIPEFFDLPI
jgi:acyl-coenzyme A thioesterase PaaI-like protein